MLNQVTTIRRYGSLLSHAVFTCWPLLVLPFSAELIQHIVEMGIGMYSGEAAFQTSQSDPLRLSAGMFKALVVFITATVVAPRMILHRGSFTTDRSLDVVAAKETGKLIFGVLCTVIVSIMFAIGFQELFIRVGVDSFFGRVLVVMTILLMLLTVLFEKSLPVMFNKMFSGPTALNSKIADRKISRAFQKQQAILMVFPAALLMPLHLMLNDVAIQTSSFAFTFAALVIDALAIAIFTLCMGVSVFIAYTDNCVKNNATRAQEEGIDQRGITPSAS